MRSQNVHFDKLKLDDVAFLNTTMHQLMARSKVIPNDVLLNITGASIGRCCYFPEELKEANVNQHVCIIRIGNNSRSKAIYLSAFLASHSGQNQIDRFNAGGNREGLNYQQLREFYLPWPKNDNEIVLISKKINIANLRISNENLFLSKVKLIKQGIMQDLLTGKVRVNVDNKENAVA